MSNELTQPADGEHTVDGVPRGSTSLTPFLAIPGAAKAVDFYREVFGARLIDATEFSGVVAHAELDFGNGHLQLGEPMPDYHLVAPPGAAGGAAEDDVCYSIALYVPNVDEVVARAVAAGATVREPAAHFVSGDRFASIRDPFGVRWSIMTRVEDLSEEESAQRVRDWAAGF